MEGASVVVLGGRVRSVGSATARWEGRRLTVGPPAEPRFERPQIELKVGGVSMSSMGADVGTMYVQPGSSLRIDGYDVGAAVLGAGLAPCEVEILDGRLHVAGEPFGLAGPVDEALRGRLDGVQAEHGTVRVLDAVRGCEVEARAGGRVFLKRADTLVVAARGGFVQVDRADTLVARTWGDGRVHARRVRQEARMTSRGGRINVTHEEGAKVRQRREAGEILTTVCRPLRAKALRRGRPPST